MSELRQLASVGQSLPGLLVAADARNALEAYDEVAELGVVLRSSEPKGVAEEAAFAYKDIESVMAASASLVRPTKRLTPLGVVKG